MTSTTTLLSLALLLGARSAAASSICYDGYGRSYYCNNGLSYGARIGIGIGIAVGVALLFCLCGYWRRRNLRNQFAKYRPPAQPYNQEQNTTNAYANNPPPPTEYQGSNYAGNPYGSNPAPPAQTYQPSTAAQYKAPSGPPPVTGTGTNTGAGTGENEHEHGYEWVQAREQERLEREQAGATGASGEPAPPGYDVATSTHNTGTINTTYVPPAGPPPGKTARGTESAV